jgi:hypothetical protein
MKFKKFFQVILFFLVFFLVFDAVKAVTPDELLREIARLQALIAQLQKQLSEIQGKPATWCYDFNVNLKIGDSGPAVEALQIALEKEGFDTSGDQKGIFGEYTASAVVGFQEKYKEEILTPLRITHGTGFVGPATRAKLNKLYGCGIVSPPIQPYIRVLSPNGGEKWEIGKTHKIRWASSGVYGNVIIQLENWSSDRNRVHVTEIAKNIPVTAGEYSWSIPENQPVGSYYKIKITKIDQTSLGEGGISDESDNYFTIDVPSPSIEVISPNGGEVWEIGKTYKIRWKSQGLPLDLLIHIDLVQPEEEMPYKLWKVVYSITPNVNVEKTVTVKDTEFSWTILPQIRVGEEIVEIKPGKYWISVHTGPRAASGQYAGIGDKSDGPFTIVEKPTPFIEDISPDSGQIGSTITIVGYGFKSHDTLVWLDNGKERGLLFGGMPEKDNQITFTLKGSLCKEYTLASGLPCPSYLNVTPGKYTIYVENLNGVSNKVSFVVESKR